MIWCCCKQNELSFQKGDKMTILQRDEEAGWWAAELNGKKGFVHKARRAPKQREGCITRIADLCVVQQVGIVVLRAD